MNKSMAALLLACLPLGVTYAALLGLGLHRHGSPWAVSAAATALLFLPPLAVGAASPRDTRPWRMGVAGGLWAVGLWAMLPVYFPGERRDAVASGLALLGGDHLARAIADRLPEESALASPEIPIAAATVTPEPPPATPLGDSEIALPYEGKGRRLSVPVVFDHGGESIEVYMMLDTGATYTTLPQRVLDQLGITVDEASPSIRLQTANGERDAAVVLADRIWLGDLPIDGVAIATCEPCASKDTVGLLGLNVAGGFNVTIDADRREVIFTTRQSHDRHLDVRPFVDVNASFTHFPGGRTEVEVTIDNLGPRSVRAATAGLRCGEETWQVTIEDIAPGTSESSRRRLPPHPTCPHYEITLANADW